MPNADEVAWALRIVAADRDGGAQIVDGRMIDAPLAARARAVIERAQLTPTSAFKIVEREKETKDDSQND